MSLIATAVTKSFRVRRRTVPALSSVDLRLDAGHGLGVVGPSGSGKSTLVHILLRLLRPDAGEVTLDGTPLAAVDRAVLRRSVQFVPQDPAASLDPRRTVRRQVGEPLRRLGVAGDHDRLVAATLERVGLSGRLADARPDRLSGGQAQRVAVARAIVTRPRYLVADEPVSSLDATLRLQILRLFADLRAAGVGVLFVTHDLSSLHRLCTHVAVLAGGRVVERGRLTDVIAAPRHPMTRTLIASAPRIATT